jgi:hypothetical protein
MLIKLISSIRRCVETLLCQCTFYDIKSLHGLRLNPGENKEVFRKHTPSIIPDEVNRVFVSTNTHKALLADKKRLQEKFHTYNTYFEDMKTFVDNDSHLEGER